MLQIPRSENILHRITSTFIANRALNAHQERNVLSSYPDPSYIKSKEELRNNGHSGAYTLDQIRQKVVERMRALQDMERSSTATGSVKTDVDLVSQSSNVNQPLSQPVVTPLSSSTTSIDDIVLSDGTNSYSLGRNVDIKISDGELIINNTVRYRFDESSNFRIYQVMKSDPSEDQKQNDILTISNGVATVNNTAKFKVYDDALLNNNAGHSLQLQIVDGNIPGQSSISNSVFFGNGTNAVPVGTLKAQGVNYMSATNDKTQMILSFQDEQGEFFIWQVRGQASQITSAFDEIYSRVQNESLTYNQVQEIAKAHGL